MSVRRAAGPLGWLIRVSSKKQKEESQIAALRRFFIEMNWSLPSPENIYLDKISGKKGLEKREGFSRAIADIEAGRISGLALSAWDRLFRNIIKSAGIYEQLEPIKGVRLFSITDLDTDGRPYDIFTQDGRLHFFDEALASDKAARAIGRNMARVHSYRFEQGLPTAAIPVWPYERSGKDIIVTEEGKAAFRKAIELYLTGVYSDREIAEACGITRARARRALTSVFPAGYVHHRSVGDSRRFQKVNLEDDKIVKGAHESIIDLDTWKRVQALRMNRRRMSKASSAKEVSAKMFGRGFLHCVHCGRAIYATKYVYGIKYVCSGFEVTNSTCPAGYHAITEIEVEAQLVEHVRQVGISVNQADSEALLAEQKERIKVTGAQKMTQKRKEAYSRHERGEIGDEQLLLELKAITQNEIQILPDAAVSMETKRRRLQAIQGFDRFWEAFGAGRTPEDIKNRGIYWRLVFPDGLKMDALTKKVIF